MKRLAIALFAIAGGGGCDAGADLHLRLHVPDETGLFTKVAKLDMTATRDGVVLAVASTSNPNGSLSISNVSYGARTVLTLEGLDRSGGVLARGRTCPIDFAAKSGQTDVYFAPVSLFAPTASSPTRARTAPAAASLTDGTVLVAGGYDAASNALATYDEFVPGTSTFAAGTSTMSSARARAESAVVPSIGLLVMGGVGTGTVALGGADLYRESTGIWTAIDSALVARVDHRAVVLDDGTVFVTGGRADRSADAALASTQTIYVDSGTYQIASGPALAVARRSHAATVVGNHALLFGGYGSDGAALDSVELVELATTSTAGTSTVIGTLLAPRAEATASLTASGTASVVLVAGGIAADGSVLDTAEVYDVVTRTSQSITMASPRHGHTSTVLSDGRVLVTGGYSDTAGTPVKSVELFSPTAGTFVEVSNPLSTARAGHAAISLCDETVLLVGGGSATAELYTPP